jgi:hypothetical protein
MKTKIKRSDIYRTKPRGGLLRPVHLTIRLTFGEYEYIARKCKDKSVAHETRQLWFPANWEKELNFLRDAHRKIGLSDIDFIHPIQRAAIFKEQNKK